MMGLKHIPVGEALELPEQDSMRALFDEFGLWESAPTEPMPLHLEPLSDDELQAEIARVFGSKA